MNPAIARKLDRLQRGEKARVLDLFSGCGGMSLGFARAGFQILAGVEKDPEAANSHAINFHRQLPDHRFELHASPRDITEIEPDALLKQFGATPEARSIDVVIGGPPCQAYARVGRAKLREIAEHPEAYRIDPRGDLYLRYLHYVRCLRPLALLMENVPDALNYGGRNVLGEMCETLERMGYVARYTLLNAAEYGVPQIRIRAFLLAYHKDLSVMPEFPAPTHRCELPAGYHGVRSTALKFVDLFAGNHFAAVADGARQLPSSVTTLEALSDLPKLTSHLTRSLPRGPRRFTEGLPYRDDAVPTEFALDMRSWAGFETRGQVYDHVIRNLPRDYPIFRNMKPGDEYPQALAVAEQLLSQRIAEMKWAGGRVGPVAIEKLRKEIVPPYPKDTFPNRWWKLAPDRPSRTLLAHLSKDSYTHIHYDDAQARTISVREAARLQSFPDGFHFHGAMNAAFRQIGNAVPPLLATRLAVAISCALARPLGNSLASAAE